MNTDDPPTTDLPFWKSLPGRTSNGHISATDHPIHFCFGSSVGYSIFWFARFNNQVNNDFA